MPAVTVRGFNGFFANKLLVMVDGRTVYTPLFGGVVWYLQQPMLDDLDRIEVVRGPGGSMWGANAVNGVINIVTARAQDTRGSLIYAGGGNIHESLAGVRYGGQIGGKTYYRVFASEQSQEPFVPMAGRTQPEMLGGWQSLTGGFRVDHAASDETQLTWQADFTRVGGRNARLKGYKANTLARLTHRLDSGSQVEVQAYFDRANGAETPVQATGDTADISAQHTLVVAETHDVVWGLGGRHVRQRLNQASALIEVRQPRTGEKVFNAFVQDDWRVLPERLTLTGGVKLERNDFTGWEFQPSVRALLKATARQTFWGAISRAIRTPTEWEGRGIMSIPTGLPIRGPGGRLYLPQMVGDSDVDAEVLWAYELGYRLRLSANTALDVSVFHQRYDNLMALSDMRFVPGTPIGRAELPLQNLGEANSTGAEISVTTSPTRHLRFTGAFSSLHMHVAVPPGASLFRPDGGDAKLQASVRAAWDVTNRTTVDAQVRHVGRIDGVSAYVTGDLRVAYHVNGWELAVVGQNLFDSSHPEQPRTLTITPDEVPRSIHGKVTWRF